MPRLLVVEDDPDMLEMLSILLESGGYDVRRSDDSDDAVRVLETSTFDLVLADLLLRSKDLEKSWNAVARFVELSRPAPVGLITAWNVSDAEAAQRGLAFVLRKPARTDVLFEKLGTTLHLPPLSDRQISTLRSYFRHIERSDYASLGLLCTDDVLYRLPGADPRFTNEVHGRDAFLAFTASTFQSFVEPAFELLSMRPLPSGALVEYIGSWRDGHELRRMPGAVMFEFRDDLIARIQVRVASEQLQ